MPDTPVLPPVATPEEVADFRSAQEKEYGQYVAVADISYHGARAYNAGDPVPASNVAAHKYDEQGLVAKVGTKAGVSVINAVHAAVTAEPAEDSGSSVSLNVTVPTGK